MQHRPSNTPSRRLLRLAAAVGLLAMAAPPAFADPAVAVCLPPQAGILDALLPGSEPLVLIAPGQNPHSFDPTPRQLARLSACTLYIAAGLPFETVLLPRLRALNPSMKLVDAPATDHEDDEHGGDDAHGGDADEHDPHFWTHPDGILSAAEAMAAALSETFPERAADIAVRLDAYRAELRALDGDLRERLAPLSGHAFLAYHPAWSHFAAEYGLRQLAIEHHGGAPSARHLAALADTVRAEGIAAILVQSESEAARARAFADTLRLRTLRVDPLQRDPRQLLRDTAAAITLAHP